MKSRAVPVRRVVRPTLRPVDVACNDLPHLPRPYLLRLHGGRHTKRSPTMATHPYAMATASASIHFPMPSTGRAPLHGTFRAPRTSRPSTYAEALLKPSGNQIPRALTRTCPIPTIASSRHRTHRSTYLQVPRTQGFRGLLQYTPRTRIGRIRSTQRNSNMYIRRLVQPCARLGVWRT